MTTTSTTTTLSERLREAGEPLWSQVFEHPFVTGLADGSLPVDSFRFYLEQDRLFLFDYARALGAAAARSADDGDLRALAAALAETLEVELEENGRLLERTIAEGAADRGGSRELGPAAQGYVSWLLEISFRCSPLEIATALLPCPWSYAEVGVRFADAEPPNAIYRDWLAYQRSDEVQQHSQALIRDLDARATPAADFERLATIFRLAVRHELAFWDAGYGLTQWPDAHSRERNA
jgi:thiaminase (transcriptional activator TenA)